MAIYRWGCESGRCRHQTSEHWRTFRPLAVRSIFLQESQSDWPEPPCEFSELPKEFKILKKTVVASKVVEIIVSVSMSRRFARFSSFYRLKKAVAWLLRLRGRLLKKSVCNGPLTVDEIANSEMVIIQTIQRESYPGDYAYLISASKKEKGVNKCLKKLNPISIAGVLRVGARLQRSSHDFDVKHSIIMPSDSHVTRLLIEDQHRRIGHGGSSHTWTTLRQRYWIVKGAATICKVLGHCLFCKRRNSSFGKQFIADLPLCRVTSGNPPFYFTGVDYFGSILVKQGRSMVKRYECVFTCLTMRAVHLEMAYSLDTNAFINALRRFVNRRGKPHSFYADNGSKFFGGCQELTRSIQDLNQDVIKERMKQQEIRWHFNPPYASHMGGIWERMIRSLCPSLGCYYRSSNSD